MAACLTQSGTPSFTLAHLHNATAQANQAMDRARDAFLDRNRKTRVSRHLCPACFYLRGTQHTNVSPTKDCELCGREMQFGTSLVNPCEAGREVS
jgi:hypothetical protein